MAQDIQIAGATFNAVPSIVVPVAGGGSATFVDPSPTTAAAADVASGKLFFDALGVLTQGSASGGGGGGLVYETGEYKPSSDVAQPTINFSNSHSTPPFLVLIEDATGTSQTTASSELSWAYLGWYNFSGFVLDGGGSTKQYARRQGVYRASSNGVNATGSNETSNTSTYVSTSGFEPSNGASYYWRSGRTYKWIAVWAPTT